MRKTIVMTEVRDSRRRPKMSGVPSCELSWLILSETLGGER